jgi:putative peptidoglycan lipid II flippase
MTPVRAALLSFGVNLGLSIVLMRPLSTVGLAIASSVASAVQAVYLQSHLARKQEAFAFRHLSGDLGKILVATTVMTVVVAAGWWAWQHAAPHTTIVDGVGIGLLIAIGVAVYAGMVWSLRVEGREDLAALMKRVRAKAA